MIHKVINLIICLNIFWIQTHNCYATNTYAPLSQIGLSIPISRDALNLLRDIPLTRINIQSYFDFHQNEKIYYELEEHNGVLKIDKRSGKLWVGPNFTQIEDTTTLIVNVQRDLDHHIMTLARVSVIVTPIEPANVKEFCEKYTSKLCFWDSVIYNVPENNHLMEEVGPLAPNAYEKLCPQAVVSYQLLNGTDYFTVVNGTLITKTSLDHENFSPGPEVTLKIGCTVKPSENSLPHIHHHVFTVNVLDQNDNGPVAQDPHDRYDIKVEHSHFRKDDELKHKSIIFLDGDSLPVNWNTRFHLENDTLHALRPVCTSYEHDSDSNGGAKQSVYSCKIIFDTFGTITNFPYCVILKAFDSSVIPPASPVATSKLCLISDSNKQQKQFSDNYLPRAEALKILQPVDESDSNEIWGTDERFAKKGNANKNKFRPGAEKVVYPKETVLFKTATNLSRVVQPLNLTTLSRIQKMNYAFQLESPVIDGLNITKTGGIVYVRYPEKIRAVLEGIYVIKILWQNYTAEIKVVVKNGESRMKDVEHVEKSYCAEFHNEDACLKHYSVGTGTGHCQWRAPGSNLSNVLSKKFGTCSTGLEYCPDYFCDPLEMMGKRNQQHICPQDCTDFVTGTGRGDNGELGIYSAVGICACEVGKCSCMPAEAWRLADESEHASPSPIAITSQHHIITKRTTDSTWIVVTSIMLFILFLLGLAVLLVRTKKYKRKLKQQELIHIQKLKNEPHVINIEIPLASCDQKMKFNFDAKWEVKRDNIELKETIGEGEFGKVVRGQVTHLPFTNNINTTVAIKMLKTGANNFELLALMSEYEMLQDLSHPNVIKLLGACTTGDTPLLIIEYCHFGSLKNFLRLSRNTKSETNYENQIEPVTEKDVLSFAWQISKGMAYLAEMKLVHRDLAARNVLVAEGKICKISDFGLTRDIYEDDAYLKKSKDRVPVKWMAPESLSDQVYTTKSDVWSFGVLCWEIITLGASPYPAVPLQNLYSLLISGYRMPRPNNCSEEIYNIIQSCWTTEPQKRPSFDHLMKKWEELLTRGTKYLDMTVPVPSAPPVDTESDIDDSTTIISQHTDSTQEATESEVMLRNAPDKDLQSMLDTPIRHSGKFDPLWTPPMYDSPEIKGIDNRKYFCDNSTIKSLQMGYDFPKNLTESTSNSNNKLRYENEPRKSWIKSNVYQRLSNPDLISNNKILEAYDVPISNKRVRSYLEMDKIDPHVRNNLNNEIKADKLSKDLDGISFQFVSNACLKEQ